MSNYNVLEAERMVSRLWSESVERCKQDSANFTVLMPPPNITGNLHIGHALNLFLQDTLVRNRRLCGDNILWQPGKDHAGIATQLLVENKLKHDHIDPKTLSRQELKKYAYDWCEKYGKRIDHQMQQLGIVCNWSRARFTLDEGSSHFVTEMFVKLYQAGLIYRDYRLVNWDCELQTAISDLEVESREQSGILWYIKYPFAGSSQSLVIATTRPETLWGDTAVAVNPQDDRFRQFIGQKIQVPLTGREVPIIGDDYVKMDYGSGALKITPAHDFNDFVVGERHNLPRIDILHADGTLNENVPAKYRNLSCQEARKAALRDLRQQDLIVKEESIVHRVPYGDRTNSLIQPRLTKQWMMNCQDLAQRAIGVVTDGQIKFLPAKWQKTYIDWLSNIQPWCLSRQLWWGHQIPVWYDQENRAFVAKSLAEAQQQAREYHGREVSLTREKDVLDTWFSSGLWSMSTLEWPENKELISRCYPTDILITSFDIIFFWVARMIMLSLFETKQIPFRQVYIHALIRDEHGRKMSKSKGNVIDPLVMIEEFGSDALRLAILSMVVPGQDICISKSRIVGYGHFVHKIWNLAKFMSSNYDHTADGQKDPALPKQPVVKLAINIRLLHLYGQYLKQLNGSYEHRNFADIVNESYAFIWNEVCDRYLECAKIILRQGSAEEQLEIKMVMRWFLVELLIALHPIMPHVTEYIWQQLKLPGLLMQQNWPRAMAVLADVDQEQIDNAQQDLADFWQLVAEIRSIRAELDMPINTALSLCVIAKDWPWLERYWFLLKHLLNLQDKSFQESHPKQGIHFVINDHHIFLLIHDTQVNKARNRQLLQQKIDKAESQLQKAISRLDNIDLAKMPIEAQEKSKQMTQMCKNRILRLKSIMYGFE